LAETLPRVAQAASHSALRNALVEHQQKTEVQKGRLDSMLETHGANTTAHTDQAMQALVNETDKMLSMLKGNNLRDAGLIASLQRLKHHEIAGYGTAAALAGLLELTADEEILRLSLDEEKQADASLTELAEREVNPHALAA
jgi:ferritin-like metal-binding protein YciE